MTEKSWNFHTVINCKRIRNATTTSRGIAHFLNLALFFLFITSFSGTFFLYIFSARLWLFCSKEFIGFWICNGNIGSIWGKVCLSNKASDRFQMPFCESIDDKCFLFRNKVVRNFCDPCLQIDTCSDYSAVSNDCICICTNLHICS